MKERGAISVITGVVTSDRMDKTIVVRAARLVRHPRYEKTLRQETTYKVHDEGNEATVGDVVEIAATRPFSKMKRWRLLRVVKRVGAAVDADLDAEEEE